MNLPLLPERKLEHLDSTREVELEVLRRPTFTLEERYTSLGSEKKSRRDKDRGQSRFNAE